jgi:23S rRNA (cytosine1962-C5)-methyltransferase
MKIILSRIKAMEEGFLFPSFHAINERYDILEEYTLPEDFKTIPAFKEGNYLKVVILRKK